MMRRRVNEREAASRRGKTGLRSALPCLQASLIVFASYLSHCCNDLQQKRRATSGIHHCPDEVRRCCRKWTLHARHIAIAAQRPVHMSSEAAALFTELRRQVLLRRGRRKSAIRAAAGHPVTPQPHHPPCNNTVHLENIKVACDVLFQTDAGRHPRQPHHHSLTRSGTVDRIAMLRYHHPKTPSPAPPVEQQGQLPAR